MNKKIKILLLFLLAAIIAVVVYDYTSTFPGKRPDSPFKYDIEESEKVDGSLISYFEVKRINLDNDDIHGFTYNNGKIYLIVDSFLQVVNTNGQELAKVALEQPAHSVSTVNGNNILVAFKDYLVLYNSKGEEIQRSDFIFENSDLTSVTVSKENIFVADAGSKQVLVFDSKLKKTGSFKGESGVSDHHGFILPSGYFSLTVNNEDELWVVNPGIHTIQHYAANGRLRRYWGKPSFGLDGFSGCCNPYFIAFLSDGSFVTSEKGLIRVKIHKPSGEFSSVVAAPAKFPGGSKAPAIAVDQYDNILLLDFDKKSIRFFEPKPDSINE